MAPTRGRAPAAGVSRLPHAMRGSVLRQRPLKVRWSKPTPKCFKILVRCFPLLAVGLGPSHCELGRKGVAAEKCLKLNPQMWVRPRNLKP